MRIHDIMYSWHEVSGDWVGGLETSSPMVRVGDRVVVSEGRPTLGTGWW